MGSPITAVVNRERILLVGGQRALVMQLAHPKVAAGVDQHSEFPARALDRLQRTLDLSLAMIYGTPDESRAATDSIRAVHQRVTGLADGSPYRADDPKLLLWVNATLIDTTLAVYQRFVRPLSARERRRYYEETIEPAEQFGIPRELIPADLESFARYVAEMLAGDELRATEPGRRLVRDVLHPPLPVPLRVPTAVVRQITLGLLPQRIHDLFGLSAPVPARLLLSAASRTSRVVLPLLPAALREFGAARRRREQYGP